MSRAILRLLVIVAAAAYVGLLFWTYANVVSPSYAYMGLVNRADPDGSLPVAVLLSVTPSIWLPIAARRPSQVVLWILYLLAYVPSVLIPYLVLGTGFAGVFPLTFAIAVSFAGLSLMGRLRIGRLGSPNLSMGAFENLVLAIAIVLGTYIAVVYGIRLELPDVADVYDVRAAYSLALHSSGAPFIAYATYWSLNVASPLAMLLGLRSRRYAMFGLALMIEILIYGITGLKSALFAVALLVPMYVLLARSRRPAFGASLVAAGLAVIAGALAWDQLTGSGLATSLFIRRVIVVPGQLTSYYYEFFTQHATYGLSHSILGWLGPGPYDVPPPLLIGAFYFGSASKDPNANFWADACANYGLAGILAFTFVLGLVLMILDGVAEGRDLRITGPVAAFMGLLLSNSGLLTTMLTHGLLLVIALAFLMPLQVEPSVTAPGAASDRRREPSPRRRRGRPLEVTPVL